MEDNDFRKVVLKQELEYAEERLEDKLKLKKSRRKSFYMLMAFGIVALVAIIIASYLEGEVNPLRTVSISLLTSTMYCTLYHYVISIPEEEVKIDGLKSKIKSVKEELEKDEDVEESEEA